MILRIRRRGGDVSRNREWDVWDRREQGACKSGNGVPLVTAAWAHVDVQARKMFTSNV